MSKSIYCVGKIKNNQCVMDVVTQDKDKNGKLTSSKRVDVVTIKMVKESSVLYKNRKVSTPSDAYSLIKDFLDCCDREMLIVCCLDTKNQPTFINIASVGTLNSSLVHPREIFKSAILGNAASIIIAHNHPSGDPNPSSEDISITTRLKEAGNIIGIDVIDHIIIGFNNYISLKEKGIL